MFHNTHPPNFLFHRYILGVLTQLGIVLGIVTTQAMGLRLATPTEWRLVLVFSFALSAGQFLLSVFMVESPTWLRNHQRLDQEQRAAARLWDAVPQDGTSHANNIAMSCRADVRF